MRWDISDKPGMFKDQQSLYVSEITAANRANVCTYSVMLADAYDQPVSKQDDILYPQNTLIKHLVNQSRDE